MCVLDGQRDRVRESFVLYGAIRVGGNCKHLLESIYIVVCFCLCAYIGYAKYMFILDSLAKFQLEMDGKTKYFSM